MQPSSMVTLKPQKRNSVRNSNSKPALDQLRNHEPLRDTMPNPKPTFQKIAKFLGICPECFGDGELYIKIFKWKLFRKTCPECNGSGDYMPVKKSPICCGKEMTVMYGPFQVKYWKCTICKSKQHYGKCLCPVCREKE